MANIIESIKQSESLEVYIARLTGFHWKNEGAGKDLFECPLCGGHNCFKLAPQGFVKCFQCQSVAFDIIQFRSLYQNITWREALNRFADELGLKKYYRKDIDWIGIRETACQISKDILYSCQMKYKFRGKKYTPLSYLVDYRQHSYDAINYFRLGFNDGTLVDKLKEKYSMETIKSSGIDKIQDGVFLYPFIASEEIKYFRLKDPNKLKKSQMSESVRSAGAYWYNQDCIKDNNDVICVEGEDDVISLWDVGENAIASIGNITIEQINYLKTLSPSTVYSCFDNDDEGRRDRDRLIKNYDNTKTFILNLPSGENDIDEALKNAISKKALIHQMKINAEAPSPEMVSNIKQRPDGYFIEKTYKNFSQEVRLTNWIGFIEAIIIREEGIRDRKVKIKIGKFETTVFMDGNVLSNASRFREFLLNNCDITCLFQGTDNDLNALVQYWGLIYNPIIVKETECVGEIEEGFIADNVFFGFNNDIKPIIGGYLNIDDKHSIKIPTISNQAGSRHEIPYFPFHQPAGGIDKFKENVFDLLIKNRNLKVAIAIGWIKATLWSKMFFDKHKFFPLMMIHGKKEAGKTIFSSWLMSMLGMRDVSPISLRAGGTTAVGLERRLAYYSSLPIWTDDYKNEEFEGQKFHTFFRNIFNRVSASKGIKNEERKIRQVIVRGCLLVDGETSPTDAALNSRMVTFELTQAERVDKYFNDIVKLEPDFAYVGFDWLKNRITTYPNFIANFGELNELFRKSISSPRQAQVWAVAVASTLTEPFFAKQKDKIINFAVRLANHEIKEQESEETIGMLWEALDILHKMGRTNEQYIKFNGYEAQLQIHLAALLGAISGDSSTRRYKLPNVRETAKILKQEPYCLGNKLSTVDNKTARRWIIDLSHKQLPEILKNMFSNSEQSEQNLDGL